ncbi:MAG: multiheme c-type cytochrome [Desulfomonilaceae bacterium]
MKRLSLTLSIFGLLAALAIVAYRDQHPVWKAYQMKGIRRAMERVQADLETPGNQEKKSALRAKLDSLRRQKPQIIEIKPFGGKLAAERCLSCHFGIEDLSASHPNAVFGCVICHGGNGLDLTVQGAHIGLRGGRNPARLDVAAMSCGTSNSQIAGCHSHREDPLLNRVNNVPRGLMATNAGIIGILRFQWGLDRESVSRFGTRGVSDGKTSLAPIPKEISPNGILDLSVSHFRKFCAACHLWAPAARDDLDRLAGCAACHAPYHEDGTYRGGDPTIDRTSSGHAATHTMTVRIPDERCRSCHNRSGRIGLNYHGQMESEQYGTPYVRGGLSDNTLSDGRFVLDLVPDIHHEKGMGCIDCHTAQDTMGDGAVFKFMKDQIEIRCEDCHGGYTSPPTSMQVKKGDPLVDAAIRMNAYIRAQEGDVILATSKGRPLPSVRKTDKGFVLVSKLTGKEHPVKIVTGDKKGHAMPGHQRLECDSCHSAWSPQCYGCHQAINLGAQGFDHVSETYTAGQWVEGRSYFRFEGNIYGVNSRGRVGVMVPGCQVWNTVVDAKGSVVRPYDSLIMKLKNGMTSVAMGSTHPHTTRREVPRCVDCHLNAKALGLGDGALRWSEAEKRYEAAPVYDSRGSGLKISYPLDALTSPIGAQLQSTSHRLSRGFNAEELQRITAIAPCLACHDRYDDPVWQRPGPYRETPACRDALSKMEVAN